MCNKHMYTRTPRDWGMPRDVATGRCDAGQWPLTFDFGPLAAVQLDCLKEQLVLFVGPALPALRQRVRLAFLAALHGAG